MTIVVQLGQESLRIYAFCKHGYWTSGMHTRENYLKIIFDSRMLNIQNLTINQPVYDGIEKIDKFINTDVHHS